MGLTDGIPSLEYLARGQISGLNVYATGSGISARVEDTNSLLKSVSIASPGNFWALIQAGSVGTDAASGGFIALRQAFATADQYAVILTPFSGGSISAFVSGVMNASSGCNIIGGPSNRYWWMAIGR